MIVYLHGCQDCGIDSVLLRKVKRYARENDIDLEIKNSKYNEANRIDHAANLGMAGLSTQSYQAIVIEDGKITRLREWSP